MFSINQRAMRIVRTMVDEADALGVTARRLANGATVIDCGVGVPGGWEAARLFCQATLGGLGRMEYGLFNLDDAGRPNRTEPPGGLELPEVRIFVDRPAIALLASQISGWNLPEMKNEAGIVPLVSGPVRAVARKDRFAKIVDYVDDSPEIVAALQDATLPDERLAAHIAEVCGRSPADLYVLVAPTASLVGSVNVVARTLESAIWRLHFLGLDASRVLAAWGKAPLPPLTGDEFTAMVRTNVFTYYGGTAGFAVDSDDATVEKVIKDFPLARHTCAIYDVPFRKLLEGAGGDIFGFKGFVHNVVKGVINNVATGHTFVTGEVDRTTLAATLKE